MTVRPSVWLTLRFTTLSSGSRAQQPRVLADAVEDDDGVVHRVAGDRQDRGHDVQRQLVVEEAASIVNTMKMSWNVAMIAPTAKMKRKRSAM